MPEKKHKRAALLLSAFLLVLLLDLVYFGKNISFTSFFLLFISCCVLLLIGKVGYSLGKAIAHRFVPTRFRSRYPLLCKSLILTISLFLGLLLIAGGKAVWVLLAEVSGAQLIAGTDMSDIFGRRNYLIKNVARPDFSLARMPGPAGFYIGKEFSIVTLSMTSAALTNIAYHHPETRQSTLRHLETIVKRMLERDLRAYDLDIWGEDPLDGLEGSLPQIGYLGHLNFMLAAYRVLGGSEQFDELFHGTSNALYRRLANRPCPYLETAPGIIFIPDNLIVLASLALHDAMFDSGVSKIIPEWSEFSTRELIDPETGLLVAWVYPDCRPRGMSRGSFSGWNMFYLPFIDQSFAELQYENFKQHFIKRFPGGLLAVREYREGLHLPGGASSGPLIFGLSPSGTGFAVSGARHHQDAETLQGLLRTAEVVGSTIAIGDNRLYLFGPLLGEAIMLAMKTATRWDLRYFRGPSSGYQKEFARSKDGGWIIPTVDVGHQKHR